MRWVTYLVLSIFIISSQHTLRASQQPAEDTLPSIHQPAISPAHISLHIDPSPTHSRTYPTSLPEPELLHALPSGTQRYNVSEEDKLPSESLFSRIEHTRNSRIPSNERIFTPSLRHEARDELKEYAQHRVKSAGREMRCLDYTQRISTYLNEISKDVCTITSLFFVAGSSQPEAIKIVTGIAACIGTLTELHLKWTNKTIKNDIKLLRQVRSGDERELEAVLAPSTSKGATE